MILPPGISVSENVYFNLWSGNRWIAIKWAPVGPVGPGPLRPIGPCAPVSPVGPVAPVAPVTPLDDVVVLVCASGLLPYIKERMVLSP